MLAEASRLAPTPAEQSFWASSAHDAIANELELHATWLPTDALFDATPSAVTIEYANHLLATVARGCYPELIAAVLPCFWIYVDVGSRLVRHATDSNPYAVWLRRYGDPDLQVLNQKAIRIVTAAAATTTEDVRARMAAAFEISAQHELSFFSAPMTRRKQATTEGPTRGLPRQRVTG